MTNPDGSLDPNDVRAALAATLAPVREHLATIERAIEEQEHELAELRELRRVVRRMLTSADPKRKPGPKASVGKAYPPSPRNLEKVRAAIRANAEHWGGIFGSTLVAKATGLHQTTASKALMQLADEGEIRLDSHKAGPGGGRRYKIVQEV